jgi:hypothetical protein
MLFKTSSHGEEREEAGRRNFWPHQNGKNDQERRVRRGVRKKKGQGEGEGYMWKWQGGRGGLSRCMMQVRREG